MSKINKICGAPGIGTIGEMGDIGERGYNIFYTDKNISGNNFKITKELKSKPSNTSSNIIQIITLSFDDKKATHCNLSIVVGSDRYTLNKLPFKINKKSNILNDTSILNVINEYIINEKNLKGFKEADSERSVITINSIECTFTDNSMSILYDITEENDKHISGEYESLNIDKDDTDILCLNLNEVNSGDYIIDNHNNIYEILINDDILFLNLKYDSPNLRAFSENNTMINTDHSLLLQNSLYSIDELYDNNIYNSKLIISSKNNYINLYKDANKCLDCSYIHSNGFDISGNLMMNDLYVNNSNILSHKAGYNIMNAITIDDSSIIIADNIDDNTLLNTMIVRGDNQMIIKKFDTSGHEFDNLGGDSDDNNFIIYYKYDDFLNTMYIADSSAFNIIKCELSDPDAEYKIDGYNINISNVTSNKLDILIVFNKGVTINNKSKDSIGLKEYKCSIDTTNDTSVNISVNNKNVHINIERKPLEPYIIIHQPTLQYSSIDRGVPSNCVLHVYRIDCHNLGDNYTLHCDVSIDYAMPEPRFSKIYTGINICTSIPNSMKGLECDYINGIRFSKRINIDIPDNGNDKKLYLLIYSDFSELPENFISMSPKSLSMYGDIVIRKELIYSTRHINTKVIPLDLHLFNLSPDHTYNGDINTYYTFDGRAINTISGLEECKIHGLMPRIDENERWYETYDKIDNSLYKLDERVRKESAFNNLHGLLLFKYNYTTTAYSEGEDPTGIMYYMTGDERGARVTKYTYFNTRSLLEKFYSSWHDISINRYYNAPLDINTHITDDTYNKCIVPSNYDLRTRDIYYNKYYNIKLVNMFIGMFDKTESPKCYFNDIGYYITNNTNTNATFYLSPFSIHFVLGGKYYNDDNDTIAILCTPRFGKYNTILKLPIFGLMY